MFAALKFFYGQPYVESIYSRVNPESFNLLAVETKKLSNFEVRDGFCSLRQNCFTGNPMLQNSSLALKLDNFFVGPARRLKLSQLTLLYVDFIYG